MGRAAAPGGPAVLETTPVRDAMTTDLVTCTPDMPLAEVAALMARHRIHSVVVPVPPARDPTGRARWSVLSDLDLVAAAPWRDQVDAGSVAASPRVAVRSDVALAEAALTMSEYSTSHVLVVDRGDGEPVGILSALDIARVLAGPEAEAPAPRAPSSGAVRPGDRLVIVAHHQGARPRDAEVLEVRGADGGPPYLVRWQDTGRVSLHYPGSDAVVERLGH